MEHNKGVQPIGWIDLTDHRSFRALQKIHATEIQIQRPRCSQRQLRLAITESCLPCSAPPSPIGPPFAGCRLEVRRGHNSITCHQNPG